MSDQSTSTGPAKLKSVLKPPTNTKSKKKQRSKSVNIPNTNSSAIADTDKQSPESHISPPARKPYKRVHFADEVVKVSKSDPQPAGSSHTTSTTTTQQDNGSSSRGLLPLTHNLTHWKSLRETAGKFRKTRPGYWNSNGTKSGNGSGIEHGGGISNSHIPRTVEAVSSEQIKEQEKKTEEVSSLVEAAPPKPRPNFSYAAAVKKSLADIL